MNKSQDKKPLLIVVSAPSGGGKTTLCDRLLLERPDIVYSISCTTRAPRGEEVDGKDYIFLSQQEFDKRQEQGLFLEHATVHGNSYGTLKETVQNAINAGSTVIMDIDVQGAEQVRDCVASAPTNDPLRRGFMDVFIIPPSLDTLSERLRKRSEDSEPEITRRLETAGDEMKRASIYKYVIVNDDLDRAYGELKKIVEQEERACIENT